MRVALNEYNIRLGKSCYLPLVSGLLRAYAETSPALKASCEFAPFLYRTDSPDNIIAQYDTPPDVAAFSVYVWSERLSLTVAAEIKKQWPRCLIIFGGAQVPHKPAEYFVTYPFIDVTVRGEGEEVFAKILERALSSRDFSDIPQIAFRRIDGSVCINPADMPFKKELDELPSPYLEGLYDDLMAQRSDDLDFQAILETTRDCPFKCSFCFYGRTAHKFKYHGTDKALAEIDWVGRNGVKYLFGADCLAEGTLIETPAGKRPIESLLPGDLIYGYNADTNRLTINTIFTSAFAGIKRVLEIRLEDGSYVEASENHRFYTNSGWKRASELTIGEDVLSGLRASFEKNGKEVLFSDVLLQPRRLGRQEAGRYRGASRGKPESLHTAAYGRERSEAARGYKEGRGGREIQRGRQDCSCQADCERSGSPQNTNPQGESSQGSLCSFPRSEQGRRKLDEAFSSRFAGANSPPSERADYSQEIGLLLDDRGESSVLSHGPKAEKATNRRLEDKDAAVLGRSEVARRTFPQGGGAAQWIREQSYCVHREVRVAVPLRRGSDMVDRSVPIRGLPESRLYPYTQGREKSHFGPRQVLASGREVGQGRERRLPLYGVGDIHPLGRYSAKCGPSGEDQSVRWIRINSITPVGIKRTYDIIEATPTHNFFAGGMLVSNSNFGMQHRDYEIAKHIVATKRRYGYPEKFRTNFGKNADERIYQIGLLLHEAQLEKGITLARQSNDPGVLKNIKRTNIKMSTYENLQVKFNDANVLVYSEFIIGLPGETLESWKSGLDETVAAGMKNQCLIYLCMVLENTDMGDPEYQKKHGIISRRVEIAEIHGSARPDGWVTEYQDLIVATNTMTTEDWRRMTIFSYVFTVLHGLKAGYFIILYLLEEFGIKPSELIDFITKNSTGIWRREIDGYEKFLDGVLERGAPMAIPYEGIYWEPDEVSFIKFAEDDWLGFYEEMKFLTWYLIKSRGIQPDWEQLADVFAYQEARMPRPYPTMRSRSLVLRRNLHEHFESLFSSATTGLRLYDKPMDIRVLYRDFGGDKLRFAREIVAFGRKNGTVLEAVEYEESSIRDRKVG